MAKIGIGKSGSDLDPSIKQRGTEVTQVVEVVDSSGNIVEFGNFGKTLKTVSFSLSATGTAVSAVSGKKLKVYAVKLVVSAAISVNFRDGTSSNIEGAQAIAANSGYIETINPPAFLFATTAGSSLDLVISGSGTAAGRISYWDDDAS